MVWIWGCISYEKHRIIIAGGRDFDDYDKLKRYFLHLTSTLQPNNIEIVSGGARGADALGEKLGKELGIDVVRFPADWDKHGKSAGYIRNAEMSKHSTHLIACWDGTSRGTKNMIETAKKDGLTVRVLKYGEFKCQIN